MNAKAKEKRSFQPKQGNKISRFPVDNSNYHKVIWTFDWIDRSGKYAFDLGRSDFNSQIILDKLINYESMTWAEIMKQTHDKGKSKHHFLNPMGLSKEAKERLSFCGLDDEFSENIFSFALTNKLRVIGIREYNIFHVLWYDPNHEVYPISSKR